MKLIDFRHRANALERDKVATVLVPDELQRGRRYPTCYLLHPFGGNRHSYVDRTSLREAIDRLGMIFVMPESGRRWLINDHQGKRYESYVLDDLIPAVEAEFPVDDRRFVGGFSMGAGAAMFFAFSYPERFAGAFGHAGPYYTCHRRGDPYEGLRQSARLLVPDAEQNDAVWGPIGSPTRVHYDPPRMLDELARRGERPPPLHIDVGLEDFPRLVMMSRVLHTELTQRGIPHEYEELPGGHDWSYVNAALSLVVPFLKRLTDARGPT